MSLDEQVLDIFPAFREYYDKLLNLRPSQNPKIPKISFKNAEMTNFHPKIPKPKNPSKNNHKSKNNRKSKNKAPQIPSKNKPSQILSKNNNNNNHKSKNKPSQILSKNNNNNNHKSKNKAPQIQMPFMKPFDVPMTKIQQNRKRKNEGNPSKNERMPSKKQLNEIFYRVLFKKEHGVNYVINYNGLDSYLIKPDKTLSRLSDKTVELILKYYLSSLDSKRKYFGRLLDTENEMLRNSIKHQLNDSIRIISETEHINGWTLFSILKVKFITVDNSMLKMLILYRVILLIHFMLIILPLEMLLLMFL